MSRPWRRSAATLAAAFSLALLSAYTVPAQAAEKEYSPTVGQEGKDVIWVPTPQALVDRMLTITGVKSNDYVMDLGSGDGRTVITAAKKFGARALGIEYNPDMVTLSQRNAEKEGVAQRAQFRRADIFQTDFSEATVITMYLLPSLNLKLRPTLANLKPGTRLVSHAFTMDDWPADQIEAVEGRTAYMWIVPAKVEGTWRSDVNAGGMQGLELQLAQHFQNVEGIARSGSKVAQLRNTKLRGDAISFSVIEFTGPEATNRWDYTGRVNGDRMEGTVKTTGGSEAKWSATRAGR